MGKRKPASDATIERFFQAVYPTAPHLAIGVVSEDGALLEAAETIERLREQNTKIVQSLTYLENQRRKINGDSIYVCAECGDPVVKWHDQYCPFAVLDEVRKKNDL